MCVFCVYNDDRQYVLRMYCVYKLDYIVNCCLFLYGGSTIFATKIICGSDYLFTTKLQHLTLS